jgi:hypothetical protein
VITTKGLVKLFEAVIVPVVTFVVIVGLFVKVTALFVEPVWTFDGLVGMLVGPIGPVGALNVMLGVVVGPDIEFE